MYHVTEKRVNMKNAVFTFVKAFIMGLLFHGFSYFTILDLEDAMALLIIYAFFLGRSIIIAVPALEMKWKNLKLSEEEKVDVLFPWAEVLILGGCSLILIILGFLIFQMIMTL